MGTRCLLGEGTVMRLVVNVGKTVDCVHVPL